MADPVDIKGSQLLRRLRAQKATAGGPPVAPATKIVAQAVPHVVEPETATTEALKAENATLRQALEQKDQALHAAEQAARGDKLDALLERAVGRTQYHPTPALMMLLKSKSKWDGGRNRWVYESADGADPITESALDQLVFTIETDAMENGFAPRGAPPRPTASPATPTTPKEARAARQQAGLAEAIQELRIAAGYVKQTPSSDALVAQAWKAHRKVRSLEDGAPAPESRVDRDAGRAPGSGYSPSTSAPTEPAVGSDEAVARERRRLKDQKEGRA